MKRSVFIFLSIIMFISLSYSQTYVSGDVSGTWTEANSPYIVADTIMVQSGETLIIEPGVEVKFKSNGQLQVYGTLNSTGTEADSIFFTHNEDNPDSTWHGIRFIKAGNECTMEYSVIEYGVNSYLTTGSYSIEGGGVFIDSTNILINHCIIKNNEASYGGGLYTSNSEVIIKNTTFYNNYGGGKGGGLYNWRSKLIILDCTFNNNDTWNYGGAICYSGNMLIANSIFYKNRARSRGAAINGYNSSLYNVRIDNCIFKQNLTHGNNIYAPIDCGKLIATNSIFQDNDLNPNSDYDISYSLVEDGFEGIGNIDTNPLFVDPDNGDFQLQSGSPCIDTGNPIAFYNDWDGTRNDMGALGGSKIVLTPSLLDFGVQGHGQEKSILFQINNVRDESISIQNGSLSDSENFSTDFSTPIQIESMETDSSNFTFHPVGSGEISAQYTFGSTDLIGADEAILELEGLGGVWSGEVAGIWTIDYSPYIIGADVTVPSDSLLVIESGVIVQVDTSIAGNSATFIIRGHLEANGTETDSIIFSVVSGHEAPGAWKGIELLLRDEDEDYGDGTAQLIYCRIEYATTGIRAEDNDVVINNCTIINNAEYGVHWNGDKRQASGELSDCLIINNGSWGVYCDAYCSGDNGSANPVIENNQIMDNVEGGILIKADGGISTGWVPVSRHAHASPNIEFNEICNNGGLAISCFADGDLDLNEGVYRYTHVNPTISNNLIYNNTSGISTAAPRWYQGRRVSFSDVVLDRNTLWNNGDMEISAIDSATITISNSIIWNTNSPAIEFANGGEVYMNYSDYNGDFSGVGNILTDPEFVDPVNNDFNLMETSPCIDTGDPESPNDPDNTRADMGALYFDQSASSLDNNILENVVLSFSLSQNYPNPFNPVTTITFGLPEFAKVSLVIYNMLGQKVSTLFQGEKSAGYHEIIWDAQNFSSGVYFYRLQSDNNFVSTKKMIVIK